MFAVLPQAYSAPVSLVDEAPVRISPVDQNTILVDFGKVAFGNLQITPPPGGSGKKIIVHFGEASAGGRINRTPPGSVRYAATEVELKGNKPLIVAPAADARNTKQPEAVLTPTEFGVLIPFRWIEIEGWTGEMKPQDITRRSGFSSSWDEDASSFVSSDESLNRIWELCKYSIKATTFAGVYVDGERERIAYEGDAYLNQLSHYYTEGDIEMARDTFDRLMKYPTWPTEWATHMIFMAHADWMWTGDVEWLAARYPGLKGKLHLRHARADGLIVTPKDEIKNDLVDWPAGERDGHVFKPVNTVMNAFHLRGLTCMAELARALEREGDAAYYEQNLMTARASFHRVLFDPARGLYRDGEGTDHASLHANLFPIAFGVVPPDCREKIVRWLGGRGMACSVYAAQYLLEGLFENDAAAQAIELITAPNDRSWKHMLDSGTTITWEAWDQKYKPNQDWNHAWGAAPANLFPRYILGAYPLAPGWTRVSIAPNPGNLKNAGGKIPTPRGPLHVRWENGGTFKLTLSLPPGSSARVRLPAGEKSDGVLSDGKPVMAYREGPWWVVAQDVSGKVSLETRNP
ncbi:family 78 glycoside hydrolase catalytic domain [Luteolibacter yonseiensis]|uniref:alpha-L-rhamnosidase n=2 Tax=Luteolibacter yonseiensis TaxID=1144680 RepID=A0A934R3Z9_9BACT|nr:family 78 glycoside hydrolase catalytic domain [Luteolibacter yonseiensis]MBK1816479.1 family 78 glycoside hydrolase catalytic domain [Luteolibacter yonseiensis]